MAWKFLRLIAGIPTEQEAITTSAGAGDTGKIPALDGAGKLDTSFMPVGIGADTGTIVASENLAAGDFVNVWDDAGTAKVRKADASNNRRAHGFVLNAVTSGQNATVYFEGSNTALSGLSPGNDYWLSNSTAGGVTDDVSAYTGGDLVQPVGIARSATVIATEIEQPIVTA